jgi:hypothetical protein
VPVAGSSLLDFAGPDLTYVTASSVTGIFGGIESALPAVLTTPSIEPFTIPLNSYLYITIPGLNQSQPVAVKIDSGFNSYGSRISASYLSKLINDAFAIHTNQKVASRSEDGSLTLKSVASNSPLTGSNARISLNGTAAALSALGFSGLAPYVSSGLDITRGIVTTSEDGKGGYTFFTKSDGYELLANQQVYYRYPLDAFEIGPKSQYGAAVNTGAPLIGRTSFVNDDTLRLSLFTKAFRAGPVVTTLSNFPTLSSGDALTVSVTETSSQNNTSFDVVFASTPASLSEIANIINSAWHSQTGNRKASIFLRTSGLYYLYESVNLSLNGNASFDWVISSDVKTPLQLVNSLNDAIMANGGGAVATLIDDEGIFLESEIEGVDSQISIAATDEVRRILGFSEGIYKSYDIVSVSGSELVFDVPFAECSFNFFASPTVLSKFGLSTLLDSNGFVPSYLKEHPSRFPSIPENDSLFNSFVGEGYISILLGELEEVGDVPDNQDTNERLADTQATEKRFGITNQPGYLGYGSYIIKSEIGRIQNDDIPFNQRYSTIGSVSFPKYTTSSPSVFSAVPKIATPVKYFADPIIESINVNDNVGVRFSTTSNASGSQNGVAFTYNLKGFFDIDAYWQSDVSSVSSSSASLFPTSFKLFFKPTPADQWSVQSWDPTFSFSASETAYGPLINSLTLAGESVLTTADGPLNFSDFNIKNAVSTPLFYPLSSNSETSGDALLRVGDQEANAAVTPTSDRYSILRSLNARNVIFCGNGVSTFGDYNGSNSLAQLVNQRTLFTPFSIHLKSGTYEGVDFTDPLMRLSGDGSVITTHVSISSQPDGVYISGLSFEAGLSVSGNVTLENCRVNGLRYETSTQNLGAKFINCQISYNAVENWDSIVQLSYNGGMSDSAGSWAAPISFENCHFNSNYSNNIKCISIVGNGDETFGSVEFNLCEFELGYSANIDYIFSGDSKGPYANFNTGLISLDPSDATSKNSPLRINCLTVRNSQIRATSASETNILLHLHSSDIRSSGTSSTAYAEIGSFELDTNLFKVRLPSASPTRATVSPFVLGQGAKRARLKSNTIEYVDVDANSVYGKMPGWFTEKTAIDVSSDGNIAFGVYDYTIRDLTILNGLTRGLYGASPTGSTDPGAGGADLVVVVGYKCEIDGCDIVLSDVPSTLGIPQVRVGVEYVTSSSSGIFNTPNSVASPQAIIRNLRLSGSSQSSSQFCNVAFVKNVAANVLYEKCTVNNFIMNSAIGPGTLMLLTSTTEKPNALSNVIVRNCEFFGGTSTANYYSGDVGIRIDKCPTGTIILDGNTIYAAPYSNTVVCQGIRIDWTTNTTNIGFITVSNNRIYLNGNLYSGPTPMTTFLQTAGILCVPAVNGTSSAVRIINNDIRVNDIGIPAILLTNANAASSATPRAIVTGNACQTSANAFARIVGIGKNGSGAFNGLTSIWPKGLETAYAGTTTSGQETLRNDAIAYTSNKPN